MANQEDRSHQQSGVLGKNTLINFLGQGVPLFFALLAIPFVIDGLGTERFGVLTIVWVVTGYFSLFDMGLGRATTKFVADHEAKGGKDSSPIIVTSLMMLLGFGLLGSLVILAITPLLVYDILNIPTELVKETEQAFYILSASIPFVLGSIGARGVLEARQEFGIVNAIKIPASIINYVGPLLVILFSNRLEPVVSLLVGARILTFFIYTYFSIKEDDLKGIFSYPFGKWMKELLGFGAWLTISNFISPIMVYMDRFIIGAMLTMSAVAYYTTPYEVISRILIISGSFMGVMFPAFSVYFMENKPRMVSLFRSSVRYVLLAVVPIVTFIVLSAEPLLFYWLGEEFAQESLAVMQILGIGIVINSLAMIPSTAMQAAGRPDIRAKIHMFELPLYLGMIWLFTREMGIVGVALAWTLRVTIDGMLITFFFNRMVPVVQKKWSAILKNSFVYTSFFVMIWYIWQFTEDYVVLGIFALAAAISVFGLIWMYTMQVSERERLFRLYHEFRQVVNPNGP